VIDDVLGLLALAVVSGVIAGADRGTPPSWAALLLVGVKAVGFVVGAIALGAIAAPRVFRFAGRLEGRGVLLVTALVLCFGLAGLATLFGLAPIVGAFAAGLILEPAHFAAFVGRRDQSLEQMVHPLSSFLVPIFFVLMGAKVDLASFANGPVLGLAALLTAAAVLGKQACALGVWRTSVNRVAVAVGMMPRGEVGLIFANIGLGLSVAGERIVTPGLFSAIVIMVILTTMIAPPALKWAFRRNPGGRPSVGTEGSPETNRP
jgi:Kef-type K+ transport system membrane component KefB